MARSARMFLVLLIGIVELADWTRAYSILLVTMGGTRSHTVPFVALGTALTQRGHNVTLASGFSGPAANNGLRELVPPKLEVSIALWLSFEISVSRASYWKW